jgi:hypothetical protein
LPPSKALEIDTEGFIIFNRVLLLIANVLEGARTDIGDRTAGEKECVDRRRVEAAARWNARLWNCIIVAGSE